MSLSVSLKKDKKGDLIWVTEEAHTPRYLLALKAIAEDKLKNLSELGKKFSISHQAAGKQVAILEKQGLATRKPLALTKKGQHVYKTTFEAMEIAPDAVL